MEIITLLSNFSGDYNNCFFDLYLNELICVA